MVVGKKVNIGTIGKMLFDLERPAFERRIARPKELPVSVNVAAVCTEPGGLVAQQTHIKEVRGLWQHLERCTVLLVEWTGVSPDPADSFLLHEMYHSRQVPVCMGKLDRKPEIAREFHDEMLKSRFVVVQRKIRRKLDQDRAKLCTQRRDGVEKRADMASAIAEL